MNELIHADEFRTLLANYHPSEAAQETLRAIRLVLLVAPSSSGRNTIINKLLKTGHYHFIVSDTTRKPRVNDGVLEQNGREYWFRTEDEVLAELRDGEFLEAAVIHEQQVSGISIRELKTARQANKIAINEVEVVGAANIHRIKPDTEIMFVVPPNFDEWMRRMHRRGELPADEVRRRLQSAARELGVGLEHDYYTFVVNDDFDDTVALIDALANGAPHSQAKQQEARAIARQLQADTEAYLARTE